MTFDRYWAAFDRFNDEEKVQFGQDMLALTPTVRGMINRCLMEPDTASRVRALHIITVLNLVESFADQVYRLGHDADPEVRSTATSALAIIPNATSKRMLHSALRDPDPRVRANAVEAVDRSGDSKSATTELLPMLSATDNRVRANAVKALLKLGVREAAKTLLRMLEDEDRAQRISALWLVDKMGLLTLAARISRMAACDADRQVRGRAQTLIESLGRQESPPIESAPEENVGKKKVTAS
jgi:HEAT repeat protein